MPVGFKTDRQRLADVDLIIHNQNIQRLVLLLRRGHRGERYVNSQAPSTAAKRAGSWGSFLLASSRASDRSPPGRRVPKNPEPSAAQTPACPPRALHRSAKTGHPQPDRAQTE